ncbi:MAG: 6-bladed beta-propeller [Acidobacteria bacterium]|uniref:6-bladed beta-propeller n=1 Tax=Candidatus Polarisedimenticola svalbardensis TaxID=2886004 RepID=A0A8J6XU42_9BACT|nr:6-bladed beta-propeller [Candidatus Polarisedimenticola svalbardensis]
MKRSRTTILTLAILFLVTTQAQGPALAGKKKKNDNSDPYAGIVWPPPPDQGRIKLDKIITHRADVVAKSKFRRALMKSSPKTVYDALDKPFDVAIDNQDRILVTDSRKGALIRYDSINRAMDVFGTRGVVKLQSPMGIDITPDGRVLVADAMLRRVVVFDDQGTILKLYGSEETLKGPTDAVLSPDGKQVYVADAQAHRIVVFDATSGEQVRFLGGRGSGEGEFLYPTSLDLDSEGNLYVVDQLNARIQVFNPDGSYLDQFGSAGNGLGYFSRPKDIVVDEVDFIYVTDFTTNYFQIFDVDYSLLTFVGMPGTGPGQFQGMLGIDVRGDRIAVVDQLNRRIQLMRFIVSKEE